MKSQYKENTLQNWYIDEYELNDKTVYLVYGKFYNRAGIYEGKKGHTSTIRSVKVNHKEKEYEIQTQNTLYHCAFDSLFYERQNQSSFKLPEYEEIKSEYYKQPEEQTLTKEDMLLVVADYADYFFENLIYQNPDGSQGKFSGYPNIGTYSDSYLLSGDREINEYKNLDEIIDIRYYLFKDGFEFYSLQTGMKNLWIENKGKTTLYIRGCGPKIALEPGKRIPLLKI